MSVPLAMGSVVLTTDTVAVGRSNREGKAMFHIIVNPQTGTPFRTVASPRLAPGFIEAAASGRHVETNLVTEPMDRKWSNEWRNRIIDNEGRHRRPCQIEARTLSTHPMLPGVR